MNPWIGFVHAGGGPAAEPVPGEPHRRAGAARRPDTTDGVDRR